VTQHGELVGLKDMQWHNSVVVVVVLAPGEFEYACSSAPAVSARVPIIARLALSVSSSSMTASCSSCWTRLVRLAHMACRTQMQWHNMVSGLVKHAVIRHSDFACNSITTTWYLSNPIRQHSCPAKESSPG
jgi:hypothetical protein